MLRRHPAPLDLGAWFDGEAIGNDVGAHVARCSQCRRRVSDMGHVRAWIRAQPFFAMGQDELEGGSRVAGRSRRLAADGWRGRPGWAAVAAMTVVLGAFLLPASDYAGDATATRRAAMEAEQRQAALGSAGPSPDAAADVPPAAAGPGTGGAGEPDVSRPAPSDSSSVLRLGLVVPTRGPLAAEGAEVLKAVRGRVAVANAAGGVGGLAVRLVVVPAENKAAAAELGTKVSVMVGGFGAGPPRKGVWLLPADPNVTGSNVVPAEASPHSVGLEIGSLLGPASLGAPVGVVRGTGPEAAMEAGVAAKARTTSAAAEDGTSCGPEISTLRQAGSVALVIAGPPDLANRCLAMAARLPWRPLLGTFVPPSSAYDGAGGVLEASGASTALAFPWPTSSLPGAARFRASTNSGSYRALVSFAAVELAIDIARQQGTISMASVAGSRWRSDLVELRGTAVRSSLVVAGHDAWLPAARLPVPAGPLGVPWP